MARRWQTAGLLLLLCLSAQFCHSYAADEQKGKEEQFKEKLKEAEELQEVREDAPAVEAQIVEEAPKTELANGDGDVSTTGACAGDIENFCVDVKPGEARIADCLTKRKDEEAKGNVEGKTLSEDCKKEVSDFTIDRSTNINKDVPLAMACKADVKKLCKDVDHNDGSAALACLRELKPKLSQPCSDQIFAAEKRAAEDYRADPDLHKYCHPDAERLCADVEPGEGRVQDCLRDKRLQLSWECQEELFRQEVENADDIQLSVRLFKKCINDKKKFCSDLTPGAAKVKDCLEEHRNDEGFSPECKEEFEKMMERRATDFRLDFNLRELCKNDIENVCGYEKDSMDSIEGFDARVISCLQDYREEITESACKTQVHKLMERASQDIRFDEPLADACYEDRMKLCPNVQPGSARVIRCLQDHREELSFECGATLFDHEVNWAEEIDFKYPMKRACQAEINKFCEGIPHGHARVIRCLQDHVDDSDMSGECKEEVTKDENRAAHDYRLNYRLNKACQNDIETLCSEVCSPFLGQACGGRVLRCLTDNQDKIASEECSNEVFYFLKMEVNDFRNDVLLAEACREDVEKFCKKVTPGEGRVHACLREHRDELKDDCRKEELKLNIIQSRDIRLRPKLQKLCSEEIAVYCSAKQIKPGKGRVFKCLQENLAKPDFGAACKVEIEKRALERQTNYLLDPGVSAQCENDVQALCAEAKGKAHEHAEVLTCLVKNFNALADNCQSELSRSVRMALWDYKPGGALTGVCDDEVAYTCNQNSRNRGVFGIGAVGRCLSKQVAEGGKGLSPECKALVIVAAPRDILIDSEVSASLAAKLNELTANAGVGPLYNPEARGASVITLTGWFALLAIVSLFTVVVAVVVFVYRRYAGVDKPYTVVMKSGDV